MAREKTLGWLCIRVDTLKYWLLKLQWRFENFREVSSLVYIDKNKYMTSFQLVKKIDEILNTKSIDFRIYTKKTLCILSLIAYSLLIKIWKFSKTLYSVSKHNLLDETLAFFFGLPLLVTLIRIVSRIFRGVPNICYYSPSSGDWKSKHPFHDLSL